MPLVCSLNLIANISIAADSLYILPSVVSIKASTEWAKSSVFTLPSSIAFATALNSSSLLLSTAVKPASPYDPVKSLIAADCLVAETCWASNCFFISISPSINLPDCM